VGQLGGRPPAKLPADLLKELGAPPVDVLEKDAWWSRLIEILTWGDLEGEAWGTKLERAVKASGAAAKLREGELKALVAKLLEREEAETNNDVIRVPRGSDQEQPARWLAEWLSRFQKGPSGAHWDEPTEIPGKMSVAFRRVWTLMLVGGRRGGKSHLACVALVMFA
jgi:hypothetical protein